MKNAVPSARPSEAPARARSWPVAPAEPWSALRGERLELVSRGDLVSGLRLCGRGRASASNTPDARLLLLVHDAGGDARTTEWSPIARWLEDDSRTVAVALDLPLHGPRASAKLTERLVSAFASLARGAELDRNGSVLVEEFLTQSVHDLGRTLDAMLAPGDLDPSRVGLIGVGLGARVADAFLAVESRVRAAVLVRTRRAPALASGSSAGATGNAGRAATPDRLELDARDGRPDWAGEARRYLDSRIGC